LGKSSQSIQESSVKVEAGKLVSHTGLHFRNCPVKDLFGGILRRYKSSLKTPKTVTIGQLAPIIARLHGHSTSGYRIRPLLMLTFIQK
jgi:hypothetical protein